MCCPDVTEPESQHKLYTRDKLHLQLPSWQLALYCTPDQAAPPTLTTRCLLMRHELHDARGPTNLSAPLTAEIPISTQQ